MMGKKALDAAKILIEETGLLGRLTPEEFLKEREAKLDELFPQAELLPGKLPTLKLPSTVLVRPGIHSPYALRSRKLFVWSKRRHFPKLSPFTPEVTIWQPGRRAARVLLAFLLSCFPNQAHC